MINQRGVTLVFTALSLIQRKLSINTLADR